MCLDMRVIAYEWYEEIRNLMFVHMCVCVCMCLCVCMCMCVCMCAVCGVYMSLRESVIMSMYVCVYMSRMSV